MATPTVPQFKDNDGTPGSSINGISTTFNSNTTATNAIVVFYTVSDFAGTHTDMACQDSFGNPYTGLNQQNTSATGGAQSLKSFYAANIGGGADTVNTFLSTIGDVEDFQANFIAEIAGVATAPLLGNSGRTQNNLAPGTNNLTSGNMTIGSSGLPGLMIACAFNTSTNGTTPCPTPGTGMTSLATIWAFGDASGANACVATMPITTSGTYAATFNQASSANEDCSCVAVVLASTPGGAGAALAAAASDVTTASGSLTTAIQMLAAAASTTSSSGTLLNYASVVLVAPLYTGVGGLLDPNFWQSDPPTAGVTVYYDPTYITIAPDGEITSTSNNCSSLVFFNDGSGPNSGIIIIVPDIVAYANDLTVSTGILSTGGPGATLAAAAATLTTAAAALTTAIKLTGTALDITVGSATLTSGAQLVGTATDTTSAVGALTTAIRLAAAAADATSGHAVLTGSAAALSAAATDATSGTGALTTHITLAAAAADITTAVAALTAQTKLVAAASDTTSAAAGLTTHTTLGAAANDTTTATGRLLTMIALGAMAADVTTGAASFVTALNLYAAALDATLSEAALGSLANVLRPINLYIT